MILFLDNMIGNELFFVYALIALVVILIIIIVMIDKIESKKKPQNLFDTLNMKIIANPDEVKKEKVIKNKEPEIIEIKQKETSDEFQDLEPIQEVKVVDTNQSLKEAINEIEEPYIETELEKTQAQIHVEEITKALEKATINGELEDKQPKDKYEQFEEEQEKNAIISYNELIKSFDKLYSENEKIQYLEDDEIPINIDELYKIQDKTTAPKKVELEDFVNIKEKPIQKVETTFKSSPYISPVYGIQKPPVEITKSTDTEIENANQFLQTLKELKSNLD